MASDVRRVLRREEEVHARELFCGMPNGLLGTAVFTSSPSKRRECPSALWLVNLLNCRSTVEQLMRSAKIIVMDERCKPLANDQPTARP